MKFKNFPPKNYLFIAIKGFELKSFSGIYSGCTLSPCRDKGVVENH